MFKLSSRTVASSFLIVIGLGALCEYSKGHATAQNIPNVANSEVIFHLKPPPETAPVKVIQVLLGNHQIPLDVPVQVSDKWVRGITVVMKNVSPRDVIEGDLIISYPEAHTGGPSTPILTSPIHIGSYPDNAFIQNDGTKKQLPSNLSQPSAIKVPPGGLFKFVFGEQGDSDQAVAYRLAGSISHVQIQLGSFYFGDGSNWRGQTYYVPATPPKIWQEITPEQFFGGHLPTGR